MTRPFEGRERVVVLDGDGSVLMNLGGLATLARYRPANLIHVIFVGDHRIESTVVDTDEEE